MVEGVGSARRIDGKVYTPTILNQMGKQPKVMDEGRVTYKNVKNLGWLLRNSDKVRLMGFYDNPYRRSQFRKDYAMVAWLEDGRVFMCEWESWRVALDWIDRPKFRGVKLQWFDRYEVIIKGISQIEEMQRG